MFNPTFSGEGRSDFGDLLGSFVHRLYTWCTSIGNRTVGDGGKETPPCLFSITFFSFSFTPFLSGPKVTRKSFTLFKRICMTYQGKEKCCLIVFLQLQQDIFWDMKYIPHKWETTTALQHECSLFLLHVGKRAALCFAAPRHVVVLMWQWVWDSVRLCAASGKWLSKSLMNDKEETSTHLKLKSPATWIHLCSCAQFMFKLLSFRDKKKEEAGAALPAVHYQFLFPSHLPIVLSFSTISSNWILCGDVLSLISSLYFTLTIVLFPFHFLHPQSLWLSLSPYLRQDTHLSALSVQYFITGGRMFYLPCPGHPQWVTHNRETPNNTVAGGGGEVKGFQLGVPKYEKTTIGMPGALCVQCVCMCMSHSGHTERSKQNNIPISWTGKAFKITWEHGIWKTDIWRVSCETQSHAKQNNLKLPTV